MKPGLSTWAECGKMVIVQRSIFMFHVGHTLPATLTQEGPERCAMIGSFMRGNHVQRTEEEKQTKKHVQKNKQNS